jgi:hypothetical protein
VSWYFFHSSQFRFQLRSGSVVTVCISPFKLPYHREHCRCLRLLFSIGLGSVINLDNASVVLLKVWALFWLNVLFCYFFVGCAFWLASSQLHLRCLEKVFRLRSMQPVLQR